MNGFFKFSLLNGGAYIMPQTSVMFGEVPSDTNKAYKSYINFAYENEKIWPVPEHVRIWHVQFNGKIILIAGVATENENELVRCVVVADKAKDESSKA